MAFCMDTGVPAGRMPRHESGGRLPTIRLHMRFVGLLYEYPPTLDRRCIHPFHPSIHPTTTHTHTHTQVEQRTHWSAPSAHQYMCVERVTLPLLFRPLALTLPRMVGRVVSHDEQPQHALLMVDALSAARKARVADAVPPLLPPAAWRRQCNESSGCCCTTSGDSSGGSAAVNVVLPSSVVILTLLLVACTWGLAQTYTIIPSRATQASGRQCVSERDCSTGGSIDTPLSARTTTREGDGCGSAMSSTSSTSCTACRARLASKRKRAKTLSASLMKLKLAFACQTKQTGE